MKKKLLITLLACSCLLMSCSKKAETSIITSDSEEEEQENIDIPEDEIGHVSDLTEETLKEFPKRFANKMHYYNSYKAVTMGKTVAKILFFETTQTIDVTAIKGDYSYLRNESHSSLVETVHVAYYHGNTALYSDQHKDDGRTYNKSTINEYKNIYGIYPFDKTIEGFDVREKSIKEVTIYPVMDVDLHDIKIVFNAEEASKDVVIQMKKFGGLDAAPKFTKLEMIITVDDDYRPVQLVLESEYKAQKGVETTCKQNYTVLYSRFNENIEIPNLEEVRDQF